MDDLISKAIDKLEVYQLVDIYEINNLKLQGFRIKGASSVAKTKRMRTNLKTDSNIREILKKTALYYREKKGKDFSWALVSKMEIHSVEEKVTKTNFGEVILALVDAEKLQVLEPLLRKDEAVELDSDRETIETKSREEMTQVNKSIGELRRIIEKLEVKNNQLTNNLELKREELKKEKDETKRLNDKLKNVERKLHVADENSREYLSKVTVKSEKIKKIQSEFEEMNLENKYMKEALEDSKRTNILFLGSKYYERSINIKLEKNKKISCNYITDVEEFEDYHIFEKIVLLAFTMNKSEVEKFLNLNELTLFKETFNFIFIDSLEEFSEYMNKVEKFYE